LPVVAARGSAKGSYLAIGWARNTKVTDRGAREHKSLVERELLELEWVYELYLDLSVSRTSSCLIIALVRAKKNPLHLRLH
jgi:hypothetical protein